MSEFIQYLKCLCGFHAFEERGTALNCEMLQCGSCGKFLMLRGDK